MKSLFFTVGLVLIGLTVAFFQVGFSELQEPQPVDPGQVKPSDTQPPAKKKLLDLDQVWKDVEDMKRLVNDLVEAERGSMDWWEEDFGPKLEFHLPGIDEAIAADIVKVIREETEKELNFLQLKHLKIQLVKESLEHWDSPLSAHSETRLLQQMILAESLYSLLSSQRTVTRIPQLEDRKYIMESP